MKAWLTCLTLAISWTMVPLARADAPRVPAPRALGAPSYILTTYRSGQTLVAKHPDEEIAPASFAKLMVSYIVFDAMRHGRLSPQTELTVSKKAWRTSGSRMFLKVGDKVSVNQLLHGLITTAGNDAAVELAQSIAGTTSTFVIYMNRYAARLDLGHTHFVNVTGLPASGQYVSATDMARLYAALVHRFPRYYHRYFNQRVFTYDGIKQYNRNSLLWSDPRVDGGVTGYEQSAGYHLAASASADGMRVIAVVLGARSALARKHECDALINYAFRYYRSGTVWPADRPIKSLRIWDGADDRLPVIARGAVNVAYPRGQRNALVYQARLPARVMAPVHKGARLGQLRILYNDRLLREVPIYAGATVKRGSFFGRAYDNVELLLGA
ncbi:D-alanyl-D-alanine carboxypeptidase family protein [Salinisphaera hydrothermalis]|uniref:D-alanyl-D-alanine carboxypeptidase family protein n=1 Tax=Salinisphaera hydrothermalis TaxID=563188 RepID=UPI003341EEAB